MSDGEKIRQIVFEVIDEINQQLPSAQRLDKAEGTCLFGEGGGLDSLGLVNLIVGVEERMGAVCGRTVNLADERLLERRDSPFRTVGALVEYLASLL
jgi:acyl carrier protein